MIADAQRWHEKEESRRYEGEAKLDWPVVFILPLLWPEFHRMKVSDIRHQHSHNDSRTQRKE